jgi:light-regulated signal transduction histidine kinase (bacteriophytochrome)
MSLYFAKMFHEQREFTRELNALVSTSDNIRNLTNAAYQASAAKADFVAGMSHELRTPLNAIIGYSQLLLEEAREEEDQETVADLGRVHKAGSVLLRLIDDILSYSRIEAGKMPLNATYDCAANHRSEWLAGQDGAALAAGHAIELDGGRAAQKTIFTDWSAVGATVRHLIAGIAGRGLGGKLIIALRVEPDGKLAFEFVDQSPDGTARPIEIVQEMFEHSDDASPTKYGGTGIEIALAFKFAQLLGGEIRSVTTADGRPAILLSIPDLSQSRRDLAA